MSLDLADYDECARRAVKLFWGNRQTATDNQIASGVRDAGSRGAVTAGKNMDGFVLLAQRVIAANGLPDATVCVQRRVLTLPGFFRPTKLWDMLVLYRHQLVAALEFKSQVGSFGNNFNNRTEEAIGNAVDLWTAYREGAFGDDAPRPFVGWLMLLEDCEASRSPVKADAPHFPVFPEFNDVSYAERYDILCRKLVQERLYTSSAFLLSPASSVNDGAYRHMSELTSLRTFVTELAGHVAAVAAR